MTVPDSGFGYRYDVTPNASFQAGDVLNVTATGGDFPGFAETVTMPAALALTNAQFEWTI